MSSIHRPKLLSDTESLLVGREREIQSLVAAARRTLVTRHGTAAVVEGDAGIGKTQLLSEVLTKATTMGFVVAQATCQELESERPFGALTDALNLHPDSPNLACSRIGRVLSADARESFEDATRLPQAGPMSHSPIADAIVAVIDQMCATHPLALAIEDVHWADAATLLTIHRLSAKLNPLPILLLISSRPPRTRRLDRVLSALASSGATRLQLRALDDEAVTKLVRLLVRAEPGPNLLRHVERASGNPLFVTEVVASLQAAGAIDVTEGVGETSLEALPSSLDRTILDRIGYLRPECTALLRVASVLGSSFSFTDLLNVTGTSASETMSVLQEPIEFGIVVEQGDVLAFRHALVRDAIYHDMPQAVRKGLHAEAGHAMAAASDSSASDAASHLSLGAAPGDMQAVELLRRAAHSSLPHSPGVAVEFLERAAILAGPAFDQRESLLCDLVSALVWAGRASEGESLARQILWRCHEPAIRVRARVGLSQALLLQDRLGESVEELDAAVVEESNTPTDRIRLQSEASYRRVLAGELDRGALQAQQAISAGLSIGVRSATHVARIALAHERFYRGFVSGAVEIARAVFEAEDEDRDGQIARRVDYEFAMLLIHADRLDEARQVLDTNGLRAQELGSGWHLPLYHYAVGFRHYQAGQWDEAIQEFERGLEGADGVETRWESGAVRSNLAAIAVHRNDLARADEVLAVAESRVDTSCPHYAADLMLWARGRILEAQGQPDRALAHLMQASALIQKWGVSVRYRWLAPDLVRLALSAGEYSYASRIVDELGVVAKRAKVASISGAAHRCRGLVDGSLREHLAAVAAFRDGHRPLDLAFACEDAGVALGRANRIPEATRLLSEALGTYQTVGADRDAARAKAALRSLGVRQGGQGRRRESGEGWSSLTPTELQIATLVAQGLTTAEIAASLFISGRTVESHLQHIFGKLRISSRVRLAALTANRLSSN